MFLVTIGKRCWDPNGSGTEQSLTCLEQLTRLICKKLTIEGLKRQMNN